MPARVFTIPPSAPFADTLARGLIAQLGDAPLALADATIFLPTRRAQRTFGDAFARVLGGAALLPSFKALGDTEDEDFLFETLDLPPALTPMRRTLLLAAMVQRWQRAGDGDDIGFAQAAALADGLAQVMDDVERQGVSLARLDDVVPGALAAHWEEVRKFLGLLDTAWPAILTAEGKITAAKQRNLALDAVTAQIVARPPKGPIIAAGSTGSIPATARLLEAIAHLPNGSVVLPGLDRQLDQASWDNLDPGHPQFGMKQLLDRMHIKRADVQDWEPPRLPRRERVLREALRPAPTTDAWRAIAENKEAAEISEGLRGVSLIEAADPMAEAGVIALVLREALEQPGRTATLVTPDRNLARRVASELRRWAIEADDSAGVPLAHTPPGAFLCLLAEAADAEFAPVPLLALLKHPLCTLKQDDGAFRAYVRRLDMLLRGPRPNPGLAGIREAIAKRRTEASELSQARLSELQYWWADVAEALAPLETALGKRDIALDKVVATHLSVADAMAGTGLQKGDAAEVTKAFIQDLHAAAEGLPAIEPGAYAALFRKLALKPDVRPQRAGHPRVAILGPLEARLQSFDTVVLGGLNEGTWPRSPGADPWFSRPMRKALDLEQPEFRIGQAAHDFAMLAAGPRVVLTRAQKSEGVPTIPSRWVQRLTQLTQGLGLRDALKPDENYTTLAESLNDAGEPVRIKMPRPNPPLAARPRRLPVTDIEKWVRDPYAIYARRILGLRIRDPLDAAIGPLERGNAVHRALERFVNELPGELPPDAAVRLCAIADEVFAAEGTPKAALALWQPRFTKAAEWFVAIEDLRRDDIKSSRTEIKGTYQVTPAFELYGTADRIDVLTDGGAAILDYKTGQVPTKKQIESFLAPQLLLEAAMLQAGGFGDLGKLETRDLLYVQISGGRVPGTMLEVDIALIGETLDKLKKRITDFSRPDATYPPRLHPKEARVSGDYDHLARVREWSIGGWEALEE